MGLQDEKLLGFILLCIAVAILIINFGGKAKRDHEAAEREEAKKNPKRHVVHDMEPSEDVLESTLLTFQSEIKRIIDEFLDSDKVKDSVEIKDLFFPPILVQDIRRMAMSGDRHILARNAAKRERGEIKCNFEDLNFDDVPKLLTPDDGYVLSEKELPYDKRDAISAYFGHHKVDTFSVHYYTKSRFHEVPVAPYMTAQRFLFDRRALYWGRITKHQPMRTLEIVIPKGPGMDAPISLYFYDYFDEVVDNKEFEVEARFFMPIINKPEVFEQFSNPKAEFKVYRAKEHLVIEVETEEKIVIVASFDAYNYQGSTDRDIILDRTTFSMACGNDNGTMRRRKMPSGYKPVDVYFSD